MHLLLLLLAPLMIAKNYDRFRSAKFTNQPRSPWTSGTTLAATPSTARSSPSTILSTIGQLETRDGGDLPTFKGRTSHTVYTIATLSSTGKLRTRDGGDLRTFNGPRRTHTVYQAMTKATTTTLPVTETFTASPSLLTTTEAITITETASPSIASVTYTTSNFRPPSPIPVGLLDSPEQRCFETLGGVQSNDTVTSGCGGMLAHIESCYIAYDPNGDPVKSNQNYLFQACVCDTSKDDPFTSGSILYRNYTGCAACLFSLNPDRPSYIYTAAQNVWNFCRSQKPSPYLFFSEFNHELGQAWSQAGGPFIPSPMLTLPARDATSTIPPLANLAYGASAPPGGSLAKVTPSLVTYTTSSTIEAASSVILATITSLVAWVPTQAGKAWNAGSASRSEVEVVSSRLDHAICKDRHLGECPQSYSTKNEPQWTVLLLCAMVVTMMQIR